MNDVSTGTKCVSAFVLFYFISPNILVVGCGTSRLSEELYEDGYMNVESIDISYSAIKLN